MKKILFYLFYFLIFNAFSQEMVIDWGVCFGGVNEWSVADAINVLSNGSIVTSITIDADNEAYTNYHGDTDPWILILDKVGNITNEKCFGGGGEEVFQDIEIFDDYIYFIGYTQSTDGDVQSEPVGGYADLWVVKTDYNLNIIWENRYGSLGVQALRTAKVTAEGGLVLLMDFFSQGGGDVSEYYGNTDIWVCEIDANGDIIWEKTLGNAWGNYAGSLLLTDDGKTIVLGETDHSGDMVDCYCHSTDGSRDIWAVGLDETGEILWQNCYGGTNWEVGYDILTENEGYTFIGLTRSHNGDVSYNHGKDDLWLVHIDNMGNLLWEKSFGGSKTDYGRDIFKTQNNGYILMGTTESGNGDVNHTHCNDQYPNICTGNTWVIELNKNREIIWNKTYGSDNFTSYHSFNSVGRIGEKDFIIADIIEDYDTHSGDIDCSPYPINNGKSAWIFRLRDCNLQLEESIPAKPSGADTICTINTVQNVYATQVQNSNYEEIEWLIEPEDAAYIIEQDTSLFVNWRYYFEGQVSIKARTISNCGESEYSQPKIVEVRSCVGIGEIHQKQLKTYPNPATNHITFQLPFITKESLLKITDIFGKQIAELSIKQKQKQLIWDCSKLPNGVYFYQTEIDGEVYRGKIVIN